MADLAITSPEPVEVSVLMQLTAAADHDTSERVKRRRRLSFRARTIRADKVDHVDTMSRT